MIIDHTFHIYILLFQLAKLIGKVKAEKYGNRIIEIIQPYVKLENPDVVEQDLRKASENGGNKRLKKKDKNLVYVESSEDEQGSWKEAA